MGETGVVQVPTRGSKNTSIITRRRMRNNPPRLYSQIQILCDIHEAAKLGIAVGGEAIPEWECWQCSGQFVQIIISLNTGKCAVRSPRERERFLKGAQHAWPMGNASMAARYRAYGWERGIFIAAGNRPGIVA